MHSGLIHYHRIYQGSCYNFSPLSNLRRREVGVTKDLLIIGPNIRFTNNNYGTYVADMHIIAVNEAALLSEVIFFILYYSGEVIDPTCFFPFPVASAEESRI